MDVFLTQSASVALTLHFLQDTLYVDRCGFLPLREVVGAEVPDADVIAKDDDNVGFLLLRESGQCSHGQDDYEQSRNAEYVS